MLFNSKKFQVAFAAAIAQIIILIGLCLGYDLSAEQVSQIGSVVVGGIAWVVKAYIDGHAKVDAAVVSKSEANHG